MNKSVLVLAMLASAVVSVPAFAAPVSASVKTADLNLSSQAGRQVLARRISFAAKMVCIVDGDRSLVAMVEGNKCYDRAVNSAQRQTTSAAGGAYLASQ